MKVPDLAALAAAMAEAKVKRFEAAGVVVELHESAFAAALSGQPQDPKAFMDMPSDDQLRYWSVEADAEEPKS